MIPPLPRVLSPVPGQSRPGDFWRQLRGEGRGIPAFLCGTLSWGSRPNPPGQDKPARCCPDQFTPRCNLTCGEQVIYVLDKSSLG